MNSISDLLGQPRWRPWFLVSEETEKEAEALLRQTQRFVPYVAPCVETLLLQRVCSPATPSSSMFTLNLRRSGGQQFTTDAITAILSMACKR